MKLGVRVLALDALHARHKIIITGTGRAGTTFLVRLLTALGQPTGYDRDSWRKDYFPHCSAGLEHDLADPAAPYIVKNPELCVTLSEAIAAGHIVVDHAIIPVRDLEAAAMSRIRIGGANGNLPGGLIGTDSPPDQQAVLATRFHELVHTLVANDIPHTFLLFPRFVEDARYAFTKLRPIFPAIAWSEFESAFRQVADPSLVHSFSGAPTASAAAVASFRRAEERKRKVRRARRFVGWTAFAAAVVAATAFRAPTAAGYPSAKLRHHAALPSTRSVLAEDRNIRTMSTGVETADSAECAAQLGATNGPTPILLSELTGNHRRDRPAAAGDGRFAFLIAGNSP